MTPTPPTDDRECRHGFDHASCAICQADDLSDTGEQRPVTEAAYDSDCRVCDEKILTGDLIVLSDEDDIWVHVECADR